MLNGLHALSGQANRTTAGRKVAYGLRLAGVLGFCALVAGCSDANDTTSAYESDLPTVADKHAVKTPAGTSSDEEATVEPADPAQSSEADPRLEPIRKGVRVIVEDEVANISPDQQVIERINPGISAEEKNALERARISEKPTTFPRPLIRAVGDILSGDVSITLEGIDAMSADTECKLENGERWACGNFAKATLQRLVRARTLSCDGEYTSDTAFSGRCRAGRTDLSSWLVKQGWAKAAGSLLQEEMEQARAQEKGLWRKR
jgi:endonuclease YncB( thermonuclease family)